MKYERVARINGQTRIGCDVCQNFTWISDEELFSALAMLLEEYSQEEQEKILKRLNKQLFTRHAG